VHAGVTVSLTFNPGEPVIVTAITGTIKDSDNTPGVNVVLDPTNATAAPAGASVTSPPRRYAAMKRALGRSIEPTLQKSKSCSTASIVKIQDSIQYFIEMRHSMK
jgi:hypothetical protein